MVKLVSEIVAVVLIVAVTVGTALLVGYFISNYIGKRQAEIPSICLISHKLYALRKNDTHITLRFEYVAGRYELKNVTLIALCYADEIFRYSYNETCNVGCIVAKDIATSCYEGFKALVLANCENIISKVADCEGSLCFLPQ